MARCADGPAYVRTEFERNHSGRKSSRAAAGRTSWHARDIVGIVCASVDRVDRLQIGKRHGHIGFTEDYCSCRFQPFDGVGIFLRHEVARLVKTPCRLQPGNIEAFLYGNGNAI